ncbi:MAG: ribulose-phosphate 3-epimerase [Candidatus Omnitrophota bacterium]
MIVPALLTNNEGSFRRMVDKCASFADFIQIDIMDGEFVPSKSVGKEAIKNIKFPVPSEAHLMVKDPLGWVDLFKSAGSRRIIFHFEIGGGLLPVIEGIKQKGLEVGIAINPPTDISEFEYLTDKVDVFLFLSVNPGFYGSAFIPGVLDKIRDFKKRYPKKIVGIDGGVKLDNLKSIAQTCVDYICVGSAIMAQDAPAGAYLQFKKIVSPQP